MHCVFDAKLRTLCLALGPGAYFVLFLDFVVLCFTYMTYFELILTMDITLKLTFFPSELFPHQLLGNLSFLH